MQIYRKNINIVSFCKRIFVVTLLAFAFNIAWAQNKTVLIDDNKISVEQAFQKIEQQTGYLFVVNISSIDLAKRIELPRTRLGLNQILDIVLEGSGCVYRFDGKNILIVKNSTPKTVDPVVVTPPIADVVARVDVAEDTVVAITVVQPDTTTIPAEPVIVPEPELEPVIEVAETPYKRLAIKTNLLLLAGVQSDFGYYGVTPNLALEYYFSKRWSVNVDGAWAGFNISDSDTKNRYSYACAGVEARHWFGKATAFKGLYAGVYGAYSQFNTMDPRKREGLGYSGDLYGGGVSLGYVVPLAPRLILELGLRGGYRYADYQTYFYYDQTTPPTFALQENLTKSSFGLQSINVSIGYRFGQEK